MNNGNVVVNEFWWWAVHIILVFWAPTPLAFLGALVVLWLAVTKGMARING